MQVNNSDLTSPQPSWNLSGNETNLSSNLGKFILNLAENFLPSDKAVHFTQRKIEGLKNNGLSLSLKLNSAQVHRLVSELGILSLTVQIAEKQNKMNSQIVDFSQMTDEELKAKEKELQEALEKIEIIHTLRATFAKDDIKYLKNLINEKYLIHLIESREFSQEALESLKKIEAHIQSLDAMTTKCWQFLLKLAEKESYKTTSKDFLENQFCNFLMQESPSISSNFGSDTTLFNEALDKVYGKLTAEDYTQKLIDQMKYSTNEQAWNKLIADATDKDSIQTLAKNSFSLEQLDQEVLTEIRNVVISILTKKSPENLALTTTDFKERILQPTLKNIDFEIKNILQKNKDSNDNKAHLNEFLNDFKVFLMSRARGVHQVTPQMSY
jgi:hypothetical protein